jgi:hypothetical protein
MIQLEPSKVKIRFIVKRLVKNLIDQMYFFSVLKKLRGFDNIELIASEMEDLKNEKESKNHQLTVSYKELLLNRGLQKPLVAAIVVIISQVGFFFHSVTRNPTFYKTNILKHCCLTSASMDQQW